MTDPRIQAQIVSANLIPSGEVSGGKLNEDRYEIYVNNDFVGYKTLLTQSESIQDVDDFLIKQGVKQFSGKLDGDHYNIETDDPNEVKDMVSVYCRNR